MESVDLLFLNLSRLFEALQKQQLILSLLFSDIESKNYSHLKQHYQHFLSNQKSVAALSRVITAVNKDVPSAQKEHLCGQKIEEIRILEEQTGQQREATMALLKEWQMETKQRLSEIRGTRVRKGHGNSLFSDRGTASLLDISL